MRLRVRVYRRWIETSRWVKAEITNALEHLAWLYNDIRNVNANTYPGDLPPGSDNLKAKKTESYASRIGKGKK